MYFVRWGGQGGGIRQGEVRPEECEIHLCEMPVLMSFRPGREEWEEGHP